MATVTQTITEVLTRTATKTIGSVAATSTHKAPPQGGIFEGGNPSQYDPKNPVILFIIQASIIIAFSRILHYPLSLIRQPRVIAEVIGGILLGPSVMGHVPGFTAAIFPTASIPNLNNVATIGLLLFLFLVGLEVDLRYFAQNWKVALSVGTAGMALPFGLGCAIAWGLYEQFRHEPGTVDIAFGTYMLFIGVAMAITAFPVLCRILVELELLSTPVGIIVLSAGVSNDVVGWVLLALCVALVNASSGVAAVWILLTCVGFILFLVFLIRPIFMYILRRSGALQDGPSQGIIVLTLMIALGSAFFTGVIGVHPIFGAFLAGLICPHEGGFTIKVTEKIEDLISALFLPLYFALSGLSTNLGLLDNGITWAYLIAVVVIAFVGKFVGGTLGARVNGLLWRESAAIGVLMSCKGLVELIVLNIGLQAKILSTRTFTIFVVMAVVTTMLTTPLTAWLYPPSYQRKLEAWKRGEIDWNTGKPTHTSKEMDRIAREKLDSATARSLLVYLRLDAMPTLLAFISLLGHKPAQGSPSKHPSNVQASIENAAVAPPGKNKTVNVHGVRLIEITERGSSVMKVSEADEFAFFDPVLNAFRVLGQLFGINVSGEVAVVPETGFADTLVHRAIEEASDLLLLPWSETGSMSESQTISRDAVRNKLDSQNYNTFVTNTLNAAQCHVAIFINRGFSDNSSKSLARPSTLSRSWSGISHGRPNLTNINLAGNHSLAAHKSHHIFMPYFGIGPDDRVALRLVLQLAENPDVTATIVHYEPDPPANAGAAAREDDGVPREIVLPKGVGVGASSSSSAAGPASAAIASARPSSELPEHYGALFATLKRSLADELAERVVFQSVDSHDQIKDALDRAREEVGARDGKTGGGDIIVVGRHAGAFQDHAGGAEAADGCIGVAARAFAESGITSSLLVVQARGNGLE